NLAANVSDILYKPYWISKYNSNYGRAILIKSDYYTNGVFGVNVEKDVSAIGTDPNRCKFYFVNGNTGDINRYQFAYYVFGHTHNNAIIDNEWMKWNYPLQTSFTRLYKRNPVISGLKLKNNSGLTTSELTPDNQMILEFNAEDNDGFSDIDTITIVMRDSSVCALVDADNETSHITIKWVENQDTWILSTPSGLSWNINVSACSSPGSGNSSYTSHAMKLVFTPGKTSVYETLPLWNIYVKVESQNQQNYACDSINVSCAFYSSISRPPAHGYIEFDTGNPNSLYNNISSPAVGKINYTVITNGAYKLYAKPSDFNIVPAGTLSLSADSYLFVNIIDDSNSAVLLNGANSLFLIDSGLQGSGEAGYLKQIYMRMTYPHQKDKVFQSQIRFIVSPFFTQTVSAVDTVSLTGYTNSGLKPEIGVLKLYNGTDTSEQTDTIIPNAKMTLNIPLRDADCFFDIDTVTVKIFHSSVQENSEDSEPVKITMKWISSIDSLYIENASGWELDYANSLTPDSNNRSTSEQNIRIVFTPSKIARYSPLKDWAICASAHSQSPDSETFSDTLYAACRFYGEIISSPSNKGIFLKNDTGSQFNGLINPQTGFFNFTFISNGNFNINILSSNFISDSEIININTNPYLKYNLNGDTSSSDSVTGVDKTIVSNISVTARTGIDTNLFLWLNYGDSSAQTFSGTAVLSMANAADGKIYSSETLFLQGSTIGGAGDPKISSIKLFDASGSETDSLSPGAGSIIKIRIQERENGFNDIDTVMIYIFHNSSQYTEPDSCLVHSTFKWTAAGDTWKLAGPENSTWKIIEDSCYAPAGSADTGELEVRLGFITGLTAVFDTQYNWIITAVIKSKNQYENGISYINVKNNFYGRVVFIDTTGIFQTSNPNSPNNALTNPAGFIRYSVVSNGLYSLKYRAENFAGGQGINLSGNNLSGYQENNNSLSGVITNTYSNFIQNGYCAEETGETKQLFLWLDYGADTNTVYLSKIFLSLNQHGQNSIVDYDSAQLSASTTSGSQPYISTPQLFRNSNGDTSTASNYLTPNEEMGLVFQIKDYDGGKDIDTVFVYIWDSISSDSGMSYAETGAVYCWTVNSGERNLQCLTNAWNCDTFNSSAPGANSISTDSELFKLVFTPSKTSVFRQNQDWKIAVKAYSKSPGGWIYSGILNVSDTIYTEINILDDSGFFNSGLPKSLNNALQYPDVSSISARIITNANIRLSLKSGVFSGGTGINVDSSNPLTYKFSIEDIIDTPIISSYANARNITPTNDSGILISLYLYLDYPNEYGETYSAQLHIKIDSDAINPVEKTVLMIGYTNAVNDPRVQSLNLYFDDDGNTVSLANQLTPSDTMTIAGVITDEDGYDDFERIDVHIYHTDYANIDSETSEKYHAVFRWEKAGNAFTLLSPPANTCWAIDSSKSFFSNPYQYDNNFNTAALLPNSYWTTNNFVLSSDYYVSPPYSAHSTTGANINDTMQLITNYNYASVLSFKWRLISESNKDMLYVTLNKSDISGFPKSGARGGFYTETINLPAGKNEIGFKMTSNGANHFENVYIDDVSVRPDTSDYNFKLVICPSKFAEYSENSKWRIDVKAISSTQNSNGRAFYNYPCKFYSEINYSCDTVYFDTGNPAGILNPIINNETGCVLLNVKANSNFDLGLSADTFTGGTGISLYNNSLGFDANENGDWQNRVFVKPDSIYYFTNLICSDSNGLNKKIYLWLDYPNEQNIVYLSRLKAFARPFGKTSNYYEKTLALQGLSKTYTSASITIPDTIYSGDSFNMIVIDSDSIKSKYNIDSIAANIKTVLTGDSEYIFLNQNFETSPSFGNGNYINTEYSETANSGDGKIQIVSGDSIIVAYKDYKNNQISSETVPAKNIFEFLSYSTGNKSSSDSGLILHFRIINNHYSSQNIDSVILTSPNQNVSANIKSISAYADSNNNDTFDLSDNLADSKVLSGNTVVLNINKTVKEFSDTDIFIIYRINTTPVYGDTIEFYIGQGNLYSSTANKFDSFPKNIINSEGYDSVIPAIVVKGTVSLQGRNDRNCSATLYSVTDTFTASADSITGIYTFYINSFDTYNLKIEQPGYKKYINNNFYINTNSFNFPNIILLGGDLNQSGSITIDDLGILLFYFGKSVDSPLKGDINNSGWVTEDDYSILIQNLEN
ncbi:MAG TPA: hypothetical protein PKY81_12300, partial [bacterium]|nr:hypothetical protein [bacterium]